MSEIIVKNPQLMADAKSIAKSMLDKGKEEVEKKLPEYLAKNAPLGVAIVGELMQAAKDSIKGKSVNQKAFIELCDNVIDSCNEALKDGKIEEQERLLIQKRVDDVLAMADESNKQYQKDAKHTALAITGGITLLGLASIIAGALVKSTKK